MLKYLGKLRVIETFGERNKKHYNGLVGKYSLFPSGTKRIVEKYFLFPKKIGENKVSGLIE